MSIPLASFPSARNDQVPADAQTLKIPVVANVETQITNTTEGRAYFEFRNMTSGPLVYYYEPGDQANGFTVFPNEYKRIVNRKSVYVTSQGSGMIDTDISIG